MILPKSFYNRPALKVAQDLLGCFLIRKIGHKIIKTKIVETEAYCGPGDLASHASQGRTVRNQVMFSPSGVIYVYFTYGLHYMLNIVTGRAGYPAAVLIRAVEAKDLEKRLPTNGPARLTKFLKIDKSFNSLPIYIKKYGLWIASRSEKLFPSQIIKTTRVGVDYAQEYKNKKWRFYIKDSRFVSRKIKEG